MWQATSSATDSATSELGRRYHTAFLSAHAALALSGVTRREMHQGALDALWSRVRLDALEAYLATFEIVELTSEMVALAAHMRQQEASQGRVLHIADSLIAATALCWEPTDMCLVSHNASDFQSLEAYGLRLLTLPL